MEAQLAFRPCIACKHGPGNPPDLLTADTAERKVEAAAGKSTLCESYTGDSRVKPFFDYDAHGEQETNDRQRFELVCAPAIQQVLDVQRPASGYPSRGSACRRIR